MSRRVGRARRGASAKRALSTRLSPCGATQNAYAEAIVRFVVSLPLALFAMLPSAASSDWCALRQPEPRR